MPGGDRTGPQGMGAMTGRAGGRCAGYDMPGYANPELGRGFGMGFGRGRRVSGRGFGGGGRGRRYGFYATGRPGWMRFGPDATPYVYPALYQNPDPDLEKRALKNQADALQSELESIKRRLSDIETGTEAE